MWGHLTRRSRRINNVKLTVNDWEHDYNSICDDDDLLSSRCWRSWWPRQENWRRQRQTETKTSNDEDHYKNHSFQQSLWHKMLKTRLEPRYPNTPLSGACKPNPCQNGGVCFQRRGPFVCRCRKGFRGRHCEISEYSSRLKVTVST